MVWAFSSSRAVVPSCLGALAILASSCTDSTGAPTPSARHAVVSNTSDPLDLFMQSRPGDREFFQLAHTVPGFGGVYLDPDGTPVVVLLDPIALSSVEPVIRATLTVGKDATLNRPMRATLGQYDFIALATWLFQLTPIHAIPGVAGMGIDEKRNRVLIRFSDAGAVPQIKATMARLGIPSEGVIVEQQAAVKFTSSLADLIRPVVNGFAVSNDGAHFSPCTIGLNASQDGTGAAYAVMAGHCARIPGVPDATQFYQPDASVGPQRLGVEIDNVAYFQGNGVNGCAAGRACTRADALLMKYDRNADQDPQFSIPVTDYRSGPGAGPGSTNYCCGSFIYAVEGYDAMPAMQGATLDRMGPVSGWTFGQVLIPCYDVDIPTRAVTILCQTEVSGRQVEGDSGSPVFSIQSATYYYLYGMATTARTDTTAFYYTKMSTIMSELHTSSYPLFFCAC